MLDEMPRHVWERIARHVPRAHYMTTLGSTCSAWRTVLKSRQRVLSNGLARGKPCEYARYVLAFPRADTLRLYGGGLDLSAVTAPNLRTLSVVLATFAPATFVAMGQLTSLELDTNGLRPSGVATIAPRIGEMHALGTLAIRNNAIGLASTAALAPEFARLTRLTDLDLSSNYLDAACLAVLAPALRRLTSLRALRLKANFLGPGAAESLGPLRAQLETLDLRRQISWRHRNEKV